LSMEEICENCEFWEALIDNEMEQGFCRRHSPRHMSPRNGLARWPITDSTDWCGEFEARAS
jgi:hypothetical protein